MGFYIDVPEGKEAWLNANGFLCGHFPFEPKTNFENGRVAVCLVDNGPFTAAGIAYCPEVFAAMKDQRDKRPKLWFMVPLEALQPFLGGQAISYPT